MENFIKTLEECVYVPIASYNGDLDSISKLENNKVQDNKIAVAFYSLNPTDVHELASKILLPTISYSMPDDLKNKYPTKDYEFLSNDYYKAEMFTNCIIIDYYIREFCQENRVDPQTLNNHIFNNYYSFFDDIDYTKIREICKDQNSPLFAKFIRYITDKMRTERWKYDDIYTEIYNELDSIIISTAGWKEEETQGYLTEDEEREIMRERAESELWHRNNNNRWGYEEDEAKTQTEWDAEARASGKVFTNWGWRNPGSDDGND